MSLVGRVDITWPLPVALPDGVPFRENDLFLLCVLLGLAFLSVMAPMILYHTFCGTSRVMSITSLGLSLPIYEMGVLMLLTSGGSCKDCVEALEVPITLGDHERKWQRLLLYLT